MVSNNQGCTDTTEATIFVDEDGILVFPNAFTPNQDGPNGGIYSENDHSNDVFYPYYENVSEFHMEVYSRWGVLLFETDDIRTGWDGYYKGKLLARDVYVWKASGKYSSGTEFLKTGTILLVK
jgi:gliding motility-associated-like protein